MTVADNNLVTAQKLNNNTREFLRMYFPVRYKFKVSDVLYTCPYSIKELKTRGRKREHVLWRSVFMLYYFMNGETLTDTGKIFNRDHSTVLHAFNQIHKARNGYDPELNDLIKQVISVFEEDIIETEDVSLNEAISLAHSESKFFERYPELRT